VVDVPDARERILRAAFALVGTTGIGQLSNREIARRAGVSLGSLTYHFASQQQLLRESLELFLAEEQERLTALTARLGAARLTPSEGAAALQALLQAEPERRVAKMELYLQASRDEELREAALACFAAYQQLAQAALAALDIERAEVLAPLVVALIDGLQLRRLASGQSELPLAEALELLLGGLRRQSP
jgi:TetR/AcrR family transcriptional regulator, regulator of biofilm formation and stress response